MKMMLSNDMADQPPPPVVPNKVTPTLVGSKVHHVKVSKK